MTAGDRARYSRIMDRRLAPDYRPIFESDLQMTYTINSENYISSRDALFANFPYIYNVEGSGALQEAFEDAEEGHGYKYTWEALIYDFRDWINCSDKDYAFFDGERHVEFLVGFKNREDAESFSCQFEVILIQEPEPEVLPTVKITAVPASTKPSASICLVK